MKREILFCGDPVLRQKAKPVHEITDEIRELFGDMAPTMVEARGVGLAAPQVGESVRAVCLQWIDESDEDKEDEDDGDVRIVCLLNPRIVEREGEQEGMEGCLSLPTLHAVVRRSARVRAEAMSLDGTTLHIEAQGLMARAIQHEIDHLNGVLFIDRAEEGSLQWMVPDPKEEYGYRFEDATWEEAKERFERMRKNRSGGE